MSSYKPVTSAQVECLRKMAIEKRLGRARFQEALDDGTWGRHLDDLMPDEDQDDGLYYPISRSRIAEIKRRAELVGSRIHVLRRVRFLQDSQWALALIDGAPNTPLSSDIYDEEAVFGRCKSVLKGYTEKDYILWNCPRGGNDWDRELLCWKKMLYMTNPREVLAVSRHFASLKPILGPGRVTLASTACRATGFRPKMSCYVTLFSNWSRQAFIGEIEHLYVGLSNVWFVFS